MFLVTNNVIEFNLTGTAGKNGSGYLFPLYLYPDEEDKNTDLFNQTQTKKYPTLNLSL